MTNFPLPYYVAATFAGLVIWSIVCRVNAMNRLTMDRVFLQHLVLGVGVVSALLVPAEWGLAAALGGLACFLWASAHRWKRGAPVETERREGDQSLGGLLQTVVSQIKRRDSRQDGRRTEDGPQ